MPPIFNNFSDLGITGLSMIVVVYIVTLIVKKLPEKKDTEFSKTLREVSESLIAHNERASENHRAALSHYATVLHNHEKIMDSLMKVIMSINIQDKAIEGFQRDIADIKCGLSSIKEKIK